MYKTVGKGLAPSFFAVPRTLIFLYQAPNHRLLAVNVFSVQETAAHGAALQRVSLYMLPLRGSNSAFRIFSALWP